MTARAVRDAGASYYERWQLTRRDEMVGTRLLLLDAGDYQRRFPARIEVDGGTPNRCMVSAGVHLTGLRERGYGAHGAGADGIIVCLYMSSAALLRTPAGCELILLL